MVDRRTALSAVLGTIAGITMPETETHAEGKEEKKIFGYVLKRTYDTATYLYQFFKNDEIHHILKANVKIQMENPKDIDRAISSSPMKMLYVSVSAKEAAEDAAAHFEYYKIKTEIIPVYKD